MIYKNSSKWLSSARDASNKTSPYYNARNSFKQFLQSSCFLFSLQIVKKNKNYNEYNMSVHLLSSDNDEFKVDRDVAERSVLIKNMLEGKNIKREKKKKRICLSNLNILFYRHWRFRCSYSSS